MRRFANNGSVLEQSTPDKWPEWMSRGQLTTKGGVLEVYMGHYMRERLAAQGMVSTGECPPANAVYAYANSLQRPWRPHSSSLLPARSRGAIFLCITRKKMGTMDPTFNPVITDNTPAFRESIERDGNGTAEMQLDES